jgi:hypothetical protein
MARPQCHTHTPCWGYCKLPKTCPTWCCIWPFFFWEMQVRFIFIKTLKFSIYTYTAESQNVQKYWIQRKGWGEENLKDSKLAQTIKPHFFVSIIKSCLLWICIWSDPNLYWIPPQGKLILNEAQFNYATLIAHEDNEAILLYKHVWSLHKLIMGSSFNSIQVGLLKIISSWWAINPHLEVEVQCGVTSVGFCWRTFQNRSHNCNQLIIKKI